MLSLTRGILYWWIQVLLIPDRSEIYYNPEVEQWGWASYIICNIYLSGRIDLLQVMTVVKTILTHFHSIFHVVLFPTLFLVKNVWALLSENFHTIFDFKLSGRIKIFVILTEIRKMYWNIGVFKPAVLFHTLFMTQNRLYFVWMSFLHHMQHSLKWTDWSASSYDRSQDNSYTFSQYFPCCFISHSFIKYS